MIFAYKHSGFSAGFIMDITTGNNTVTFTQGIPAVTCGRAPSVRDPRGVGAVGDQPTARVVALASPEPSHASNSGPARVAFGLASILPSA
jgi:hypothetical protein